MRIAVFIKNTTQHAHYGGLETQNKVLCQGLVSKGHKVTVFSPQRELKIPELSDNGVEYIFIPSEYRMLKLPFRNSNNWFVRSAAVFKKMHQEAPYDVVLSQSSAGAGVIRQKKELKVKVVSISHGSILSEFKTKLSNTTTFKGLLRLGKDLFFVLANYFGRQREFILGSDKVVAVSAAVKSSIIEETFVPDEKVEVIYNGVDPLLFEKGTDASELTSGKPVKLVFIGRVVRSKGLFLLVDVLKSIKEQNYLLEIVGDGEDMEELKGAVKNAGLEDKVIFTGKVDYRDVVSKLFNSDVFILPTLRVEGFPMTIPEAMLASLPVIASDMGGIAYAVEDGETGFLVESGDREALREKIVTMIGDRDLRLKMGNKGREKALEEFTLEKMIIKYENVLGSIINRE